MDLTLKEWMRLAGAAGQEILAHKAGTTRRYLYALASGRKPLTPEMAARLEEASQHMPFKLKRKVICPVCAACPYNTCDK